MNRVLVGLASLPFLAANAFAGPPNLLSDQQMDRIVAGGLLSNPASLLVPSGGLPDEVLQVTLAKLGIHNGTQPGAMVSEGSSSAKAK